MKHKGNVIVQLLPFKTKQDEKVFDDFNPANLSCM